MKHACNDKARTFEGGHNVGGKVEPVRAGGKEWNLAFRPFGER